MTTQAKIVMLLEDLDFGGTQRQALELAHRLDRRFFDVELWMMRSGMDFELPAGDNGVTFRWLADTRTAGLRSILQTARHLNSKPVDILVLLTAIPNIWGRLLGRCLKVPVILATIRGEGSPFRQHERWLWRLADHHLCNSEALKTLMVHKYGIPEPRVSVIVNGIDCTRFHPPSAAATAARAPVVLCVARLVPDKDLMTLVSAFELVAAQRPDARLLLVGDGPLRGPVISAATRRLPRGRFQWLPGLEDLLPLYQEASLFALSSVREGLPNVVLEAMACGLPVVATRVGGLEEAVEHGRTGLLARPRDPETLGRLMLELLNDEERRAALGRAGRRRAEERFAMNTVARCFERFLLQLMEAEGA